MSIDIVIPCYNEQDNIENIVKKFNDIKKDKNLNIVNIILVNDGSTDNTWEKIKEIKDSKIKIIGIKLSKNFGQQYAFLAGIAKVKSNYALLIDADFQDPPEKIKEMFDISISTKANCVYGERISRKDSFMKKLSSSIFYSIINFISNNTIKKNVGDFKLIDKKIINFIKSTKEKDIFLRGLIATAGFKQIAFRFNRDERVTGKSGWTIKKLIKFSLDGILSFSNFPLRIILMFSGIFFLIFILFGIDSYINYKIGLEVPGWKSIFLAIMFVSSLNFLILSIIGEYIGRIHMEVKNRPRYIVDEIEIIE
jgi:dolichol-phosphate mannosyltransferase